ncbi:unnamed protein product [Paramecium sonneborni]|uniref:Uncharacterized protein n=1 Tax=Paramecium sonneborni TaxID=65129 RepID=A0A8S1MJ40_9CILI|nr:unnamed protein product [Paramecium sonneborni]
MDFKKSFNDSLEKMHRQTQQYTFLIKKKQQKLLEQEQQLNYFVDILQSELYSKDDRNRLN